MTSFFAFLTEKEVEYKRDASLLEYTTMRVGATADAIVYPHNVEKLISVVRYLKEKQIKYKIVGRMSNILPPDTHYFGIIISTLKLDHYRIDGDSVHLECGVMLSGAILRLAKDSLGGLESLFGIPGTVGGAVYSNAGAFGLEISDVIRSAFIYDVDNDEIREILFDEMKLSYRKSVFSQKNYILLSATFTLSLSDQSAILEKIKQIKNERNMRQPTEYPSLGSIFKRYGDVSAAFYIDKVGLRSFSIGGAEVSDKHAGFIINKGNATAGNIKELISYIKGRVYDVYSIRLEEEIEYL